MEKLTMCRICLAEDVRMHLISGTHLHDTYESLTTMPFVTEDNRPLQVCYICCARLQNCYNLLMRCLQSEKWFSQMLNMEMRIKGCTSFLKRSTVELIDITFGDVVLRPELCNQVEIEFENSDARTSKSNLDEQEIIDIVHEPGEQTTRTSDTVDVGRDEDFQFILEEQAMVDIVNHELGKQTTLTNDTVEDVGSDEYLNAKLEEHEIDIVKHEPGEQTTLTSDTVEDVGSDEYLNANLEEHEMIDIVKHEPGEQTSDPVSKQSALTTEWNVALSNFKKCENSKDTIVEPEPDTAIAHEDNIIITLNERNYDVNEFKKNNSITDHNDVEKEKCRSICIKPEPNLCDSSRQCFNSKYYFEKHIRTHTDKTPHQCNVCKKYFSSKGNLNQHIRTHTGEKPFQCNVCKKCFSLNWVLNSHIRTHTGEKPFQCNVCKKCFSQKCSLKTHIRTHTDKPPHKCNVCKKYYSTKSNLSQHIRIHTGEKPFQCNVCKKCFSLKWVLNSHIRTHTGEEPFQCNVCKKCFSQKWVLKSHIRIHT